MKMSIEMRKYMAISFKSYRIAHGLSQESMSEHLGITTRAYADLERHIFGPSALTMVRYMFLLPDDDILHILSDLQDIQDCTCE